MSKTSFLERPDNDLTQAQLDIHDVIRENIVHALGRPTELRGIQVTPLWNNHYRVNVFVGPNSAALRIANSFFVKANDDGALVSSNPPIEKMY